MRSRAPESQRQFIINLFVTAHPKSLTITEIFDRCKGEPWVTDHLLGLQYGQPRLKAWIRSYLAKFKTERIVEQTGRGEYRLLPPG
jgi:hypothetical protein